MKQIITIFVSSIFSVSGIFATEHPSANEIITLIKNHLNLEWSAGTVDTFKCGNPGDAVTGVVSCMFADMSVLQEAVAKRCNLIITHEPVFYNHADDTSFLKDDPVFQEKKAFIDEHRLIIWRFHDHWHRYQADGIYTGMLEKLGWTNRMIENDPHFVRVNKQKLEDLADYLYNIFLTDGIRVIGDPTMEVSKIGLALGATGAARHIQLLQGDIDVLIAGEAQEWETYQYVNDAVLEGHRKAVIFLGHINSEEAGMDYFSKWLKQLNPGVPVFFVPSTVPYWSPE